MNHHVRSWLLCGAVALAVLSLGHCAGVPLEDLYEAGVTTPLITLSYEGQSRAEVTKSSDKVIEIKYRLNRPLGEFVRRLQPSGKIECSMKIVNEIGGGHNYPYWGASALTFELESLSETGILKAGIFHDQQNLRSAVDGTVKYYIIASYVDQGGKKHRGLISNELFILASFYDRF